MILIKFARIYFSLPKKMGRRRKTRTHVKVNEAEQEKIPKSFVIRSGDVGPSVAKLVLDVRRLMEPNTAIKLKVFRSFTI